MLIPRAVLSGTFGLFALCAAASLIAADGAGRNLIDDAAEYHERGVAFHLQRSLDEASREYALALKIDPARVPTAAEIGLIERFAPRLFVTASEPFRLVDAAAILHPSQQVIAYHFFWDDDIDFPDDNEPCDHELVWVTFGAGGTITGISTYFHGRLLDGGERALKDAMTHGMRPFVAVQWGKHGSMPFDWQAQTIAAEDQETESVFLRVGEPTTLEDYNRATFQRLATEGARAADHPLARRNRWPRTFQGAAGDFMRFTRPVEILHLLREKRMIAVSRWNSAVINQLFIRYNFKPKLEWPLEDPD